MTAATVTASNASNAIRARRRDMRAGVKHEGVSLAGLVLAHEYAIDRVEIRYLVRWMPYVGETKARRILFGLPHRQRLGDLTPGQRAQLARNIADHEQRRRR
jgi:hypothetical protein